MAAKFRNILATRSLAAIESLHQDFEGSSRALAKNLRLHFDKSRVGLTLPVSGLPGVSESDRTVSEFVTRFSLDPDNGVEGVSLSPDSQTINYHLNTDMFVRQVLKTTSRREKSYDWTRNALFEQERKNIVVEFSSPNIAKPFHVGHLRSTILGNFVANIQERVGHRVTRLNYLGDWGTQFGLLMAGLARRRLTMEAIKSEKDPVKKLLEVYIEANSTASKDEQFALEARQAFQRLEEGDEKCVEMWRQCRAISLDDLSASYSRLGVRFDHYHGESMYRQDRNGQILDLLEDKGLLTLTEDGRKVVQGVNGSVTVVKSDGTSLYISRDIAAAVDRKERFDFDRMYYVVDNTQQIHFQNLFHILGALGHHWSNDCTHIRFGKILGMSTRKGSMVTVEELVSEARAVMRQGQNESPNTRVRQGEEDATAEAVALSALIVHDLSKKTQRDYKFDWKKALSRSGNTGVKLQYCHARLHSLLDNCTQGLSHLDEDVCTKALTETVALDLAFLIGLWEEVLSSSASSLQSDTLLHYLFSLANSTNRALVSLQVKSVQETDPTTARARLLLFSCSKKVLAEGLTVLGIKPLDQL